MVYMNSKSVFQL